MAKALRELDAIVSYATALHEKLAHASESGAAGPAAPSAGAVPAVPPTANVRTAVTRPRVGVGVAITRSDMPGRVLIGARQGSHGAGKWALPGGHLETGESWACTASREVEEETGLLLREDRFTFVAVTNDPMPEEGLHYLTLFMRAELSPEEAAGVRNAEPDKCLGWEWLSWDEVRAKALFIPLQHFIAEDHYRKLG